MKTAIRFPKNRGATDGRNCPLSSDLKTAIRFDVRVWVHVSFGAFLCLGKAPTGWDGDPRLSTVHNDVIRGETTPEKASPASFARRRSWRISSSHSPSGAAMRTTRESSIAPSHHGSAPAAAPTDSGRWGGWDAESGKKVVGTLISPQEFKELFKVSEWNDVMIRAQGDHIRQYLNGRLIVDFTGDPKLAMKQGILALQLHAGAPMWVDIKDIRIKAIDWDADRASGSEMDGLPYLSRKGSITGLIPS